MSAQPLNSTSSAAASTFDSKAEADNTKVKANAPAPPPVPSIAVSVVTPFKTYAYGSVGAVVSEFVEYYNRVFEKDFSDCQDLKSLKEQINNILSHLFLLREMRFWEADYGNSPVLDQSLDSLCFYKPKVIPGNDAGGVTSEASPPETVAYLQYIRDNYNANDYSKSFNKIFSTKLTYFTKSNRDFPQTYCLFNFLVQFVLILRHHGVQLDTPELGYPLPFLKETDKEAKNESDRSKTCSLGEVMADFEAFCKTGKSALHFSKDKSLQIQTILEHCLPYQLHFWKPHYHSSLNKIWLARDIHDPIFRTPKGEQKRARMSFLTYVGLTLISWVERRQTNPFMHDFHEFNLYYLLKTLASLLIKKGASLTRREDQDGFAPPFVHLVKHTVDFSDPDLSETMSEERLKWIESGCIVFCPQPLRDIFEESITVEHLKQYWISDGKRYTFLDYVWLQRLDTLRPYYLNLIYKKIKTSADIQQVEIKIRLFLANPETLAIADKILIALQQNQLIRNNGLELQSFLKTNSGKDESSNPTMLYLCSAFMKKHEANNKKMRAEVEAIEGLVQMVKQDCERERETDREVALHMRPTFGLSTPLPPPSWFETNK